MIIGSFALIRPFSPLADQFAAIKELGVTYADITDNHDGATLGTEYGFAASASLDSHPAVIREMAKAHGITLTSVCAHADLLDPTSPDRYQTTQIIKAIKFAHFLGVHQVITTEGDPKTEFGHSLTPAEQSSRSRKSSRNRLDGRKSWGSNCCWNRTDPSPIRLIVSEQCWKLWGTTRPWGSISTLVIPGWAGVSLYFIKTFGQRIKHVHWKDMGSDWIPKRGTLYGCGMGSVPLGEGVVGIPAIIAELQRAGFNGPTTLEVAGEENVRTSLSNFRAWTES